MIRSIILAIISGLLFAISWPTNGFPGFLFVAFVPLLIIEHQFSQATFKKKGRRIFFLSWLAFAIWNALAYAWLSQARPQIDATSAEIQQAWMAYLFPVILNSMFMAIIFLLYHKLKSKSGNLYGFIFLISLWMSFEKLHLNWELAWPWLNLGNGFASYYKWVQWYEFTGTFGGTLWVFVVNIAVFYLIMAFLAKADNRLKLRYGTISFGLIFIPIIISLLQYSTYEEKGEEISVLLLQPELNPYREKYIKTGDEIVDELLMLADNADENTQIVLGPETAFPGKGQIDVSELHSNELINKIRNWVDNHPNTVFISGIELVETHNATKPPNKTSINYGTNRWYNAYNSVIQIVNNVDSIPIYNKSKLVVGVELFPYPEVFKPLLGSSMFNFGGSIHSLTTQRERVVFENGKNVAKVAPTVCYESIFGEFMSKFVKNGANIILVSTNDSWWGVTDGHRQFLDYARLRAIENRRDVARAANSGVSAFINQKGDLIAALPYETQGTIEKKVKLNNKSTFYSQYGDFLARIALLLSGILMAYGLAQVLLTNKR